MYNQELYTQNPRNDFFESQNTHYCRIQSAFHLVVDFVIVALLPTYPENPHTRLPPRGRVFPIPLGRVVLRARALFAHVPVIVLEARPFGRLGTPGQAVG